MVRWLVITIVLLGLILLVAPIPVGIVLESRIQEGLARVAENGGPPIAVEYDRGLYSSEIRSVVELSGTGGEGAQVAVDHTIVHGPIPFAAPSVGGSPFDLVAFLVLSRTSSDTGIFAPLSVSLDGAALLSSLTRVGVTGNLDSEIEAPAFEDEALGLTFAGVRGALIVRNRGDDGRLRLEGGATRRVEGEDSLDISPFEFKMVASRSDDRVSGELRQGGIRIEGEDGSFKLGVVEAEFWRGIAGGNWAAGESTFTVADMVAVESDVNAAGQGRATPNGFAVRGIEVEQEASRSDEDGLYTATTKFRFARLEPSGRAPEGPGSFTVSAQRLDADAVDAFRLEMDKLTRQAGSPEELNSLRMMSLMTHLPSLLGSSPVLAIEDAAYATPDGDLTGSLRVSIDGSDPAMLADLFSLMTLMQADAKLDGTEPLVRRFFALLPEEPTSPPVDRVDALIEQGILVRTEDRLTFDARFHTGFPMVNGRPADPSVMLNMMPSP